MARQYPPRDRDYFVEVLAMLPLRDALERGAVVVYNLRKGEGVKPTVPKGPEEHTPQSSSGVDPAAPAGAATPQAADVDDLDTTLAAGGQPGIPVGEEEKHEQQNK